MESSTWKAENLKPIILKAGVPFVVSIAGVIYAWIITKKSLSKASLSQNKADFDTPETKNFHHGTLHEESYQGLSSMEDEEPATPFNSSVHSCLEQDTSCLRRRIEDLQMRELALNLRFDKYCDMKEQESLLIEIKNMLSLESARVEFLDKEISSLEAENMRLENFVVQYLRVVEQLECWRSQNRELHRKVQKLLRKSKAQSRLIKEQAMKIKAEEAEILRNHDALQTRIGVINKLEDEIKELQGVLDQLQDEKNELLKKLDTAEKAYASKVEAGDVSKEDYKKLLNELEQIKKERAAEAEELIRLRWMNACLKHELMRHNEQQQQQQQQQEEDQDRDHIRLEFEGNGGVIMHYESDHESHHSSMDHHTNNVPCFGSPHSDHHASSKRKRLLKRLKRWVEGSEKVRVMKPEGENHVRKSLGMHSVPHVAKETHVPARRSCSSA